MPATAPFVESQAKLMDTVTEVESAIRILLQAARQSLDGHTNLEPRMTLEACVDGQPYTVCIIPSLPNSAELRPRLSPRELDIARLIAKGLPTKTIALRLGLRPCTVSTYTKRIYLKLNVNSRAEMVAKLLSEHWLRYYPLPSA